MPHRPTLRNEYDEEEFDPVKYLKSLDLETFLDCDETRTILMQEHFWKYEKELYYRLSDLYEKINNMFQDRDIIFGNDLEADHGGVLTGIVYDNIIKNYNLELFYDNPKLAKELFKLPDK